jgi:hypothetical protein
LPDQSITSSAGEQSGRDFEAESLRGLQVDHEFELVYLLDR